ncbi:hypothetical protein BJ170DRAFT_373603 [Xylariales sp. AK1849]|nr:hypothetical protein BJ170DRAFT_373603 [Xylariales sp. AK1849]
MPPASTAHPQLSRRYGKYDFERFDHLLSQQASLGAASIGKVDVDCRFLFKKSKWGVLTEAQNPAGIIYLDLNFRQPKHCRLKSATVTVTLDDDDEDLVKQFSGTPAQRPSVPVQIGSYGPHQFNGQARHALRASKNSLMPHVDVTGIVGAGGMGRETEKTHIQESRWTFSSQLKSDPKKKNSWAYRVLQWELTENELESQAIHSNLIHTAFSFEHDGQPFFMQVEVGGKLESVVSDLKNGMKQSFRKLKFPSNGKDERYATTLVNFGGRDKFRKPLDEWARSLPLAMEQENMNSVPIELPNSQAATFHEDTLEAEQLALAAASKHRQNRRQDSSASGRRRPDRLMNGTRRRPMLEQTTPGQILGEEADGIEDPSVSDMGELANALLSLTRPRVAQNRRENTTSDTTRPEAILQTRERRTEPIDDHAVPHVEEEEVEEEEEDDEEEVLEVIEETTPAPRRRRRATTETASNISTDTTVHEEQEPKDEEPAPKPEGKQVSTKRPVDPDAVLLLLKLSGILSFVQVIVGLLSSMGVNLSPRVDETDKAKEETPVKEEHRNGTTPKSASKTDMSEGI